MKIDYATFYATLPGITILVVLESIEMIKERRFGKDSRNMFTSVCIGAGAIIISAFIKAAVFFVYAWIYQYRLFTVPSNTWWAWVICFFADDISYYWFHRCSHQVRFLWASHAVHHTPETFTLSSALRLPWTSNISGTFLFWAWMPLIGISPAMIILMKSLSAVYQFWLHTEKIKKLPKWIELIFNTPSNHRVHHGSNADYLDKNHGGTLMLCDHLFGTFLQETHRPVYGLTNNLRSSNPFVILFNEWSNLFKDLKKAKKPVDFIYLLFGPPGWSNSADDKTTRAIQEAALWRNKSAKPGENK